jgi:Toprim-like
MSLLHDIVISEIQKIPGPKRNSGQHTFITCPYHNEKTPSGRILHRADGIGTGRFRCYGCGQSATWNQLAKLLGLQTYGKAEARQDSLEVPKTSLDDFEGRLLGKSDKLEQLCFYSLLKENAKQRAGLDGKYWRGFSLKFLDSLGFKFCRVEATGRFYIYLPIEIRGETKGYIKAQPSYINSKGSWSLKFGLFPYDQAVSLMNSLGVTTLCLVEGPRDALRLIKLGIPAICIMGTHSWSKGKFRQLEFTGASRIILMMDGDKAGRSATKLITTGVHSNGSIVAPPLSSSFQVKTVRLWRLKKEDGSGYDPGDCPLDVIEQVKALLK